MLNLKYRDTSIIIFLISLLSILNSVNCIPDDAKVTTDQNLPRPVQSSSTPNNNNNNNNNEANSHKPVNLKPIDDSTFIPRVKKTDFDDISNAVYLSESKIVLLKEKDEIFRSEDNGDTWKRIDFSTQLPKFSNFQQILSFPFNNNYCLISTDSNTHYFSIDQGKNWNVFKTENNPPRFSSFNIDNFSNDGTNALFSIKTCKNSNDNDNGFKLKKKSNPNRTGLFDDNAICKNEIFYINKSNKTPQKIKNSNLKDCAFTNSKNANMNLIDNSKNNNPIVVCVEHQETEGARSRIIKSIDFFNKDTTELKFKLQDENSIIKSIKLTGNFLVASIAKDVFSEKSSIDLYISKDLKNFDKARVEVPLYDWMFSLDSASDSLFLKIVKSGSRQQFSIDLVSDLYKSDSSGLTFHKINENLIANAMADTQLTKNQEIDGMFFVLKSVSFDDDTGLYNAVSEVSTDYGETWGNLNVIDDDQCTNDPDCHLHLFWLTEINGDGTLVTGPTSGILMGIGNTGKTLSHKDDDYNTYLSKDGGLTWRKIFDTTSSFSFGNLGNIIVSIPFPISFFRRPENLKLPSSFFYSLDQGESWYEGDLGFSVFPKFILTSQEGISQQFIVMGVHEDKKLGTSVFSIDFSKAFGRSCSDKDFEYWSLGSKITEPVCVNGLRSKYKRRITNSDCFVSKEDSNIISSETCECTIDDTECNSGFQFNTESKECEPVYASLFEKYCENNNNNKKKLKISSRIFKSSTTCSKSKDKNSYSLPSNDFELDCSKNKQQTGSPSQPPPASDGGLDIITTVSEFGARIGNYIYLDSDPESNGIPDETLLIHTQYRDLYVSYDGGLNFKSIVEITHGALKDGAVESIYLNPFWPNYVYLLTNDNKIYISSNRAISFEIAVDQPMQAIKDYTGLRFTFDKSSPERFIWYGYRECSDYKCKKGSYYTLDGGKSFHVLLDDAPRCNFAGSTLNSDILPVDQNLIICDQEIADTRYFKIISSTDYFNNNSKELFAQTIGSASTGAFFVVAEVKGDDLVAQVSVNGDIFAEALFPKNLKVDNQRGYTILNSKSNTIFLHVTTNNVRDDQYGSILKSNFNGTSYVMSIQDINRDNVGYVDYESIVGLEGVAIANRVMNTDKVNMDNEFKRLKTFITHNDGAQWTSLMAPKVDSDGKKYECDPTKNKLCTLNLHSFTERTDYRDSLSSGSAVGLMFGVGNVGEFLGSKEKGSVFFTRDGGVTWREIVKGNHIWEYGDQGSILVLVKENEPTRTILVSIDGGESWFAYEFSKKEVAISDIVTVPSDTARRFLLISKDNKGTDYTFTIDFQNTFKRQCDISNPNSKDFEYWSPKHPLSSTDCLLGHKTSYLRRRLGVKDCFIGAAPLSKSYKTSLNCECTRQDFECDYNFAPASDGTCKLIEGLSPNDNSKVCSKNSNIFEFWEPTGYRKIPLSTCESGLVLDKWSSHACPGREREYNKAHGSGFGGLTLFFVICIPLGVFIFATFFVYEKGIKRNGGFARFGEIRLDDDELNLIENDNTDRAVNAVVKFGVFAFTVMASVHRTVSNFFKRGLTSRFRRDDGLAPFSLRADGFTDDDHIIEEDSLFGYHTGDDDDAREIDSFLESGVTNDIGDDNDDDTFFDNSPHQ
ncbi:hypothetical protein B5S32_g3681 [[Candida] boidinii]|nr:hypothetical protein B5S32_g3681 [[Candida] boidinii]